MEINRVVQGGTGTQAEILQRGTVSLQSAQKQVDVQTTSEQNEEILLSSEYAQKIVEGLNTFLTASNSHLKFVYHEKLQKFYVTIVDNRTDEVIKEIPPKRLLDMVASMSEHIGLIIDTKI
jgi:flagellar protein FlaG